MSDSYWVRHRSLRGFVGPLSKGVLHGAVAAGSLPVDCEVRLAVPGASAEKLDDTGWTMAHELLGLPAPPPPEPRIDLPPPGAPGVRVAGVRGAVRQGSSYAEARRAAKVLALALSFAVGFVALVTLVVAWDTRQLRFVAALGTVIDAGLGIAAIYLVHQAFQMLADLADCALRRETDAAARRVADGR